MNDELYTGKVLWLIRGIPGSGKTTFAKSLGIQDHYEADMWMDDNGGYSRANLKFAHEWCQKQVFGAMYNDRPVVVSNTFIKRWEMDFYKTAASNFGYTVVEVTMNGRYTPIRDIPFEVIERMERIFEM